jgi:hypothetical protein
MALAEGEGFFVIGNLTTALYQSGTWPELQLGFQGEDGLLLYRVHVHPISMA